MKTNFFIIFLNFFLCPLSFALPDGFYKDVNSLRFVKNKNYNYYTVEGYSGDLVVVYERRDSHTDILMGKYEAKFINPVDGNYSYNNFYQINKSYSYENGKITKISYQIGKMDSCFVKCGTEFFYKKSKVYKKNKYPGCLSLLDMETRKLNYKSSYVEKNCISD